MKNLQWKKLILCLALPLAVGGLAAWLTMGGMADYASVVKPPLSPPGWVFPVVWTALYLMMGWASYLVWTSGAETGQVRQALLLYGAQLAVNFLWPLLFFGGKAYLAAFFLLAGLWLLVWLTLHAFLAIREPAGKLLLPYLAWITFAGYLNLGVYLLN